jgi:hypothetical protein
MLSSKVNPAIDQVNLFLKNEGEDPIPSFLSRVSNPFFFLEIDRLITRLKNDIDLEEKVSLYHRLIFIFFLKVKKGNIISFDVPLEAEDHIKKRKEIWKSYLELNQNDRKQLYFAYRVMLLEANRSVIFKSTFPFDCSKKEKQRTEGSCLERSDKQNRLAQSISRRRDRLKMKKVNPFLKVESEKEEKVDIVPHVETEKKNEVPPLPKPIEEKKVEQPKKETRKCEAILKTGKRPGEKCDVRASFQKGNSWFCGKHNK